MKHTATGSINIIAKGALYSTAPPAVLDQWGRSLFYHNSEEVSGYNVHDVHLNEYYWIIGDTQLKSANHSIITKRNAIAGANASYSEPRRFYFFTSLSIITSQSKLKMTFQTLHFFEWVVLFAVFWPVFSCYWICNDQYIAHSSFLSSWSLHTSSFDSISKREPV